MINTAPCPQCRRLLQLPESMLGQFVQCPSCQTRFEARWHAPAQRHPDAPPVDAVDAPPFGEAPLDESVSPFAAEALPDEEAPGFDDASADSAVDAEAVAEADAEAEAEASAQAIDAGQPRPAFPPGPRTARRRALQLPVTVQRPRNSPVRVVALLAGVIFAVWVLLRLAGGLANMGGNAWQPGGFQEDDEERRRAIIAAFQRQKPLDPDEMTKEITPLLEQVRDSFKDRKGAVEHFDLERLFDEVKDQGLLPPEVVRSRRDFVHGMGIGMDQALQRQAEVDLWTSFEIRNLKKLQGNEAVVIVRHKAADGTITKIRWWVSKRTGQWKVYDYEDLDTSMRISTVMASVIQGGIRNAPAAGKAMQNIGEAMIALGLHQDADAAERKLQAAAGVPLPRPAEGLRHLAQGMIHLQRNRVEDALASWEQSHRSHPDMPALDLFKAVAYNRLARWEDALKHLKTYEDLLGDDANVCREKGQALLGLNRKPEAAAAYRKALGYNAEDMDCFLGLLDTQEPHSKELAALLKTTANARATFDLCADDCVNRRDGLMLERLAAALRSLDPRHPSVDYYAALAKAWRHDITTALKDFGALLAKEKDAALRDHFLDKFVDAAADTGKAEHLYAALPDAKEAFRMVAAELHKRFVLDELRDVVAAHKKKHPGDPLLVIYEAQLHLDDEEHEVADKEFLRAAKLVDAATLDFFRAGRVAARYHTGNALPALKEIEPRRDTFRQLAHLCLGDKKLDLLEALLGAYAELEPDDPEAARFRMRLAIRRGNIDAGVAQFRKLIARETDQREREITEDDFIFEMVDADKVLAAYRALPEPRAAFERLVEDIRDRNVTEFGDVVAVHRQNHPRDPLGAIYQGELHLDERNWAKAAAAFSEAIELAGGDSFTRDRAAYSLVEARYELGQALQVYDEAEKRTDTFQRLAVRMHSDRRMDELAKLVEAHRRHAPGDAELLHYQSLTELARGRIEPGVNLLKQAHAKQTLPYRKDEYVRLFVVAMHDAGHGLAGYRAAPNKPVALETLANQLLTDKKPKELETLLEEHRELHGETTKWLEFAGELSLLKGQAAEAEQRFRAALDKQDRQMAYRSRRGLERAVVMAGKSVAHYRAEGGRGTFLGLVNACVEDKNAAELAALIAERRKTNPKDRDLLVWETELKALNKDHEGVLKTLTEHREKLVDNPRQRWRMQNLLVRTLIELKRFKDAVREAEEFAKTGDRLLPVLAHASAGDVAGTIAALEKASRRDRYLVEACYRDPQLGPILRSDAFAEFRKRFPEPKGNRPAGFDVP
jgi:predicted Zn-dependent protease